MSIRDDLIRFFAFPGEYRKVPSSPLAARFDAIRSNYRRKQAMVDAGLSDWYGSDPYEVGNWPTLFTPIENALWCDIRAYGLDLWPQLPVGKYFVDFGNPIAKVAVECDGAAWHMDKGKDRQRDERLERMGWAVIRIPGRKCNGEILSRQEAREDLGVEDYESWRAEWTPYEELMQAKDRLERRRP